MDTNLPKCKICKHPITWHCSRQPSKPCYGNGCECPLRYIEKNNELKNVSEKDE